MINCNAFILAAGLGTRLQPLTNDKPKGLVEIKKVALLELVFNKLYLEGIRDFAINVHHFAEQMIAFIDNLKQKYKDANILIADESKQILDTGGALKTAVDYYKNKNWNGKNPLLVYNVDIISNINIADMLKHHLENNNFISLAVQNRISNRNFIFNDDNNLIGWENESSGEQIFIKKIANNQNNNYKKAAFSGIHILSKDVFKYTPNEDVFTIKNWYLQLAEEHKLAAYFHNKDNWADVGRLKDWERINNQENN